MQMQQLYIAIILYDSVYCISTVIYIGTIPWKENFNQSIPTIYFNDFLGEAFTLIPKIEQRCPTWRPLYVEFGHSHTEFNVYRVGLY